MDVSILMLSLKLLQLNFIYLCIPSYEDFTECFALWAEQQSENATNVFTENSRFMEEVMTVCWLFAAYHEGC